MTIDGRSRELAETIEYLLVGFFESRSMMFGYASLSTMRPLWNMALIASKIHPSGLRLFVVN